MAGTQFVVDLGDVKLTEEQKMHINSAIQKAATGALAQAGTAIGGLALFPVGSHGPKFPGHIIWGIIARPIRDEWLKGIETK